MCDHVHYRELETRVVNVERSFAVIGEQIRGLVEATKNLKWVVYGFTLLLLLTVIYGAIGEKGFNNVTRAYEKSVQHTTTQYAPPHMEIYDMAA